MTWACPTCEEKIKFNPKAITDKAKKCPYCHQFIHPKGLYETVEGHFLGRIMRINRKNSQKYKKFGRVLFACLFSLVISLTVGLSPALLNIENWSSSWIIALVIFFTVVFSWTRPSGVQPVVLISFITLIFIGLGNLWQKENFELRNRPFIEIPQSELTMSLLGTFKPTPDGPEPKFELHAPLINHGPIPASMVEVLIKAHPDKSKVFTQEAITIGADSQEKNGWHNIDIFPNGKAILKRPFRLNKEQTKALFRMEPISSGAQAPSNDETFTVPQPIFYFVLQLKYYGLNEENKKAPYWYWVLYRYEDWKAQFLRSGSDKTL